ncbi:MAG: hypothetical protein OEZ06_13295 [Myxococcales bacterium]|nr:hypothetical protein [Myxococcales bacterium]
MLAAYQEALVALSTDAALRRRFKADPKAALADYELSPSERAMLAGLEPARLEHYAQGLIEKRWRNLARVWPCSLQVARNLERRYRRLVDREPPQAMDTPLPPGPAEALRVLPRLRHALERDAGSAPYAAELLCFETFGGSDIGSSSGDSGGGFFPSFFGGDSGGDSGSSSCGSSCGGSSCGSSCGGGCGGGCGS